MYLLYNFGVIFKQVRNVRSNPWVHKGFSFKFDYGPWSASVGSKQNIISSIYFGNVIM